MTMEKAEPCPMGTEITTELDCRKALKNYKKLGIEIKSFKAIAVGSWNVLPHGCSYRAGGDNTFYFNKKQTSNVKSFLNGMSKMICKKNI